MGCILSIIKLEKCSNENTTTLITNKHCFTCGKSFTSNISYNRHIPTCQNKK